MSENTNLAEFSSDGLNIGNEDKILSYLHGMSDFWIHMFADSEKINLLMEANSVVASDIYNKFLQLTSVISLEDISTLTNTQVKLELLSAESLVSGEIETYSFPSINSARYIANRAFLPTTLLEEGSDFYIDVENRTISFSRSLSDMGFPFRFSSTGVKEFALWFIDSRVDDQLVYNHYAKIIDISPTGSTINYRNFVHGVYYLYVSGPNLEILRRGLNLTLGIPLAREAEEVLEIRKYPNTDNYLVITDSNSYLIPYGITPTVSIGDLLVEGDDLATWIEVKDYESGGDWWINFKIPAHILPDVEEDSNRYATVGSYADWVMRNYLKKHTFLVNVKTELFKNIQNFDHIYSLVKEIKPSHTTFIYVWTIPIENEDLTWSDDKLDISKIVKICASLTDGIHNHIRDSSYPLGRDCPHTMRMSANMSLDLQSGYAPELNGYARPFNNETVTGFIAPQRAIRPLDAHEAAWNTTLRNRDHGQYRARRGWLDRGRGQNIAVDGTGVHPLMLNEFLGYRMVYLHTTILKDVENKFNLFGLTPPPDYLFTLFRPITTSDAINEYEINSFSQIDYNQLLIDNFNYLFSRSNTFEPDAEVNTWRSSNTWRSEIPWGSEMGPILGAFFPRDSYKSFKPEVSDLTVDDFLAFTRIVDGRIGVFWITKNQTVETPPYWPREVPDSLSITVTAKLNRNLAVMGSPLYQLRSGNVNITYIGEDLINQVTINEESQTSTSMDILNSYSDAQNTTSFPVDRSGRILTFTRNLR